MAETLNLGVDALVDENAINRFYTSFSNLPDRPDYDGYLTLKEANEWYRTGQGQPLFTDLSKINFGNLSSSDIPVTGKKYGVNLLIISKSLNDGLVYGNITIEKDQNRTIRAYADFYDFDMKSWSDVKNWGRNIETIIGQYVAGQGSPYTINIYNSVFLP